MSSLFNQFWKYIWLKFDNDWYYDIEVKTDALLQDTTLQKASKSCIVMHILKLFLKKFYEFGPRILGQTWVWRHLSSFFVNFCLPTSKCRPTHEQFITLFHCFSFPKDKKKDFLHLLLKIKKTTFLSLKVFFFRSYKKSCFT